MAIRKEIGKICYGGLFVAAWPALLVLWAGRLDMSGVSLWPQPFPIWVGTVAVLAGGAMMSASMWVLWRMGKGLPMNAYPPVHFVTSSTYAFFSHPIYVAFVVMVAGFSILGNSPAAFWIITPISALSVMALVLGYEGPKLRERFGVPEKVPLFGVPPDTEHVPTPGRRIAAGLMAFGPWVFGYSLLSCMPAPPNAVPLRLAFELSLPRPEWAIWLYSAAYPLVGVSPLFVRSHGGLRRMVIGAWIATCAGFFLMLVLPGNAALLPADYSAAGTWLANANRTLDAEWLAFPAFHALWAVFVAQAIPRSAPRLRMIWWTLAVCISVSCLLTGAHAVADVLAGMGLGILCWQYDHVLRALTYCSEQLSNSWAAVALGPVRIINHAIWSFTAAATGLMLVLHLAGPEAILSCGIVVAAGLLGAGAWGYWLEGGHRLSRPFGYYGFMTGGLCALAALALFSGIEKAGVLMAGFAAGAPLAQAIGRLRCLVQGCCHGRRAPARYGIRVLNPRSRVTALAKLRDVPVYPTQLYSILSNLVLTAVMLRLWSTHAPWTVISGLYLLLSSLARFAEEQYRGEPQTAKWGGLAVYQWLAVAFFLAGVIVTMVNGIAVRTAHWWSPGGLAFAAVAGLTAAFLMSVDFPRSERRFSRLTVS